MKYGALFSPIGTLKQRGRQYEAVLADLRLSYAADKIARRKTKRQRHLQASRDFKQQGALP